jgi:hypothetical protein
MTLVLTAHANSKEALDHVASCVRQASESDLRNGTVALPEGTTALIGESTPKPLYEQYCWHERIEVTSFLEAPPAPVRKIYTSDSSHPFINRRAEGQTWGKHDYVDGATCGLHFDNEEVVAAHIIDRKGESRFCKEFLIFLGNGQTLESDGWWTVHPPFLNGQLVYFLGSFRGQKPPVNMSVKKCQFFKNLYFTGCWKVTATITVGSPSREIGVCAASWMFSATPELPTEEGYCFQVRQYYHDYAKDPGYTTAVSGSDLPCYRTQEEAIAFLQSTTFAGGVIRHVMRRGLDTGLTAGVVYERFEGTRDYELARKENALVLAAAARKAHLLVREEQSYYPRSSLDANIDSFI